MALTKAQLIDLNANELVIDLDADTSITADTDDQIDIKIAGADDFTFTANTFTALSGSSIVTPTLSVTSSATISGGAINLAAIDIDGATDIGAAIVDADLFIVDDGAGGTNRKTTASRLKTYIGGGITNAQSWRITSSFTVGTSETDISSNWEESDSTAYARIGSIVSQSSGIFTFGATGIYLMLAVGAFRNNAGTRSCSFNVKGTTNNSTYTHIISGENNNSDFGGSNNTSYHTGALPAIFDVTDTGQVKFRFTVQATGDTQTCDGDQDRTYTGFTIVRLGDT